MEIQDENLLKTFSEDELTHPAPRKFVNDITIYASRPFDLPKRFGDPVLSDFGSAVRGDVKRNHDAQPAVYRAPETMLGTVWSYPVDIWNVGATIWDVYQCRHLFYGNDPVEKEYMTRAHLAEVIAILGPPPLDLLARGRRSREFFAEDGTWIADVPIPPRKSLEDCEHYLEGGNKKGFMNLVKEMLQWRPEDRKTAKELIKDPWINSASEDG